VIVDADEMVASAVAEREPGERLLCPWPGHCTRELNTEGALERHLVKDHGAVFRHPRPDPAPEPEPLPAPPTTGTEPDVPAPGEETPMAPRKYCAKPGCDREVGPTGTHSGRHRGQSTAEPAPRPAPEVLEQPATNWVDLPVVLSRGDFERLEAIAFLAREDTLVTVVRMLRDVIAEEVEADPLVQQVADLRAAVEEVPA
jgi:hypothetical protein